MGKECARIQQRPPKRLMPAISVETKKKKAAPVKVVHIANPVWVTTSAAEFRGLVQRLTGRHSNVADMVFDHSSAFVYAADDEGAAGDYRCCCRRGGGSESQRREAAAAEVIGPYVLGLFDDGLAPALQSGSSANEIDDGVNVRRDDWLYTCTDTQRYAV